MTTTTPETTRGRVRIEPNPKWIRGTLGGRTVVDSRRSRFVWEIPYYPAWYFPVADVAAELRENGNTVRSPSRGEGTRYDLVVDDRVIADAAWRHLDSPIEELRDHVRIEWDALDAWFEEEVEVFIHPRSPYARIDALPTSRHVRVLVDGEVMADSRRAVILFETGLPPRYYLPKTDVRMDLLSPSDTSTGCPYKGFARYWDATVGDTTHRDLVWGYPTPLPESEAIAGLVSFYNEKVVIEVDGELLERPRHPFRLIVWRPWPRHVRDPHHRWAAATRRRRRPTLQPPRPRFRPGNVQPTARSRSCSPAWPATPPPGGLARPADRRC